MTIKAASPIYQSVKDGLITLGYSNGLLRENYEFADIFSPDLHVKTIKLAAFFQDPPSYHSACFGVVIANGLSGKQLVSDYRSLGAPQVLEVSPEGVRRWGIPSQGEPHHLEFVEPQQIVNFFDRHKLDWSPDNINRAKSAVGRSLSRQLDFFDIGLLPLLDREVQTKLDKLLTEIVSESCSSTRLGDSPKLFRLLFRLIAAKILADRKHAGNWLQSNPKEVIKEVENFYFKNQIPEPVLDDNTVQVKIWDKIRNTFHFQNLSVEALAYVYENTLITEEFRRRTSTHGTPPAIAEYIVRHLPFEELGQEQRRVFEPFSGHAVFLVAALRRLRELLPTSMTASERHNYFVNMLSGLEYDEFAREIARLSLVLADYPNPNGWRLDRGDVFGDRQLLQRNLSESNVVLCNPPFGDFTDDERKLYPDLTSPYKPAEILRKVMARPPKLLGFVLPRVFLFGRGYRDIRKAIGDNYSSVEILGLPDNTFKYSGAETVLLIASGSNTKPIRLTTGDVYKGQLEKFYSSYIPSYRNHDEIADSSTLVKGIWLPELDELWKEVAQLKTLDDYTSEISRGIEYNFSIKGKSLALAVSDYEKPGFIKGLHRVSDGLESFIIVGHKHLNVSPEKMRVGAYKLHWEQPKVIVNARRRTSGHWKLTAAPDFEGLYCYQSFHSIWPRDNVSLEVISSVLNGPLANAYVSAFEGQRDIRVSTLKRIPMPDFSSDQIQTIAGLVHRYQEARNNWLKGNVSNYESQETCTTLIKSIDAEVLKVYDLPPKLERLLLDYFADYKRPVPIKFTRYYPEGFQAYIPWHIYISQDFQNADVKTILRRLNPVNDPSISKMLSSLEDRAED